MLEVPQSSTYFHKVTGLYGSLEILEYDQESNQEDNEDKLDAPITGRMEVKKNQEILLPFYSNIVRLSAGAR